MLTLVQQAATFIQQQWNQTPPAAVILGTGLGHAARQVDVELEIPFAQIPHFPRSTALSHDGRLLCGRIRGIPALVMAGRCHLYEGYSYDEITRPVRVLHALGAKLLIVSNASGGLNPRFRGGQIMVIEDHINLMFPARWPAGHRWQTSLNLRSEYYDADLIEASLRIARRESFMLHRGVYAAVTGPNYETRAEYRLLRRIGGDAVGMSTVPEVVTAAQLGMHVLALSMITNVATPDAPQKTKASQVVEWAAQGEPNLSKIILGIFREQVQRKASNQIAHKEILL